MGKNLKIKKWNLVPLKPEKHILRCKTAINIKFKLNRKKKHSFIDDIKLEAGQITRKVEPDFNKPLFISKSNIFKSRNDYKLSSNKPDTIIWN